MTDYAGVDTNLYQLGSSWNPNYLELGAQQKIWDPRKKVELSQH